ncbi:uncharacterized protein PpBr36_10096 [Pyricularia pennisetigena]|uniref:uncharacterized protein n=1 Tax=Pyricularia pennisetigena TaxID=1578925 RepID=UPI0011515F95|nr:uncharacterized protein PpBr36_10096 [Pyricularia pennisetigena]TLS22150.1 hypothetical protein PpBr36_10096 [Pyricularia pennisetigena]
MQIFNVMPLVALFALGVTAAPMPTTTDMQASPANRVDSTILPAQHFDNIHQKRQSYYVCRDCNRQFKTEKALQNHKDSTIHP